MAISDIDLLTLNSTEDVPEALVKSLKKEGLVQVERQVQGKTKVFTRKYWVRTSDVKSTDKVVGGKAPKEVEKDDKKPATVGAAKLTAATGNGISYSIGSFSLHNSPEGKQGDIKILREKLAKLPRDGKKIAEAMTADKHILGTWTVLKETDQGVRFKVKDRLGNEDRFIIQYPSDEQAGKPEGKPKDEKYTDAVKSILKIYTDTVDTQSKRSLNDRAMTAWEAAGDTSKLLAKYGDKEEAKQFINWQATLEDARVAYQKGRNNDGDRDKLENLLVGMKYALKNVVSGKSLKDGGNTSEDWTKKVEASNSPQGFVDKLKNEVFKDANNKSLDDRADIVWETAGDMEKYLEDKGQSKDAKIVKEWKSAIQDARFNLNKDKKSTAKTKKLHTLLFSFNDVAKDLNANGSIKEENQINNYFEGTAIKERVHEISTDYLFDRAKLGKKPTPESAMELILDTKMAVDASTRTTPGFQGSKEEVALTGVLEGLRAEAQKYQDNFKKAKAGDLSPEEEQQLKSGFDSFVDKLQKLNLNKEVENHASKAPKEATEENKPEIKVGAKVTINGNRHGVNPRLFDATVVSIERGLSTQGDKNPERVLTVKTSDGNTVKVDEGAVVGTPKEATAKKAKTETLKGGNVVSYSTAQVALSHDGDSIVSPYATLTKTPEGYEVVPTKGQPTEYKNKPSLKKVVEHFNSVIRNEHKASKETEKQPTETSKTEVKTDEGKAKDFKFAEFYRTYLAGDKDKALKYLEDSGVTWKKSEHKGVNYMRACMAAKKAGNYKGSMDKQVLDKQQKQYEKEGIPRF